MAMSASPQRPESVPDALAVERICALAAAAFSDERHRSARIVTGERGSFACSPRRGLIDVPFPPLAGWTLRTLTLGVALQCSPTKDAIAARALHELTHAERRSLVRVEGASALAWVVSRWPGLASEIARVVPEVAISDSHDDADRMLREAIELARRDAPTATNPVLGVLPATTDGRAVSEGIVRRIRGRMPWSSRRRDPYRRTGTPVGGDGGTRNANLPPPSRPEDDDPEIRSDRRVGVPYPEWNMWRQEFIPDHVAVLERAHPRAATDPPVPSPEVRKWFEQPTVRTIRRRLEDGSDIDVDAFVAHRIDELTGHDTTPRIFQDLVPTARDVTTALLLDGSSSLGVHQGRVFALELACADALSTAMTAVRERHGIFVFSGNTRHRVDVRCLKDFADRHFVAPATSGLATGGYTRLGAPLRHLTSRLLAQPTERRLLIVVGDGLVSDEGYEGRYGWADAAHAVEEAEEAGVVVYYLGLGPVRVDPLPEIFGPRRSRRIHRVEQLPSALAAVHRELVAA